MIIFDKIKFLFGGDNEPADDLVIETENKTSGKPKENYIENKNVAISIICNTLSMHQGYNGKDLAVLYLWVITPEDNTQIPWADSTFKAELQSALAQEGIEAIKQIELISVSVDDFREIARSDSGIKKMARHRLYYKLTPMAEHVSTAQKVAPTAWLECITGQKFVQNVILRLDTTMKNEWHIGRSAQPSQVLHNDIVINDECRDVSRQQAAIVTDNGNYYIKCKEGGCRTHGGKLTKIIRSDGREEELMTMSPKAIAPLADGDVIQISKVVFYRFSFTEPISVNSKSALDAVDDSF